MATSVALARQRSRLPISIDYDESHFVEVKPRHNSREKDFYTWREDASPLPPGALDRIIYSDSVLQLRHSYVLKTTTMTDSELAESGLKKSDVLWKREPGQYDHLPMVADFIPQDSSRP